MSVRRSSSVVVGRGPNDFVSGKEVGTLGQEVLGVGLTKKVLRLGSCKMMTGRILGITNGSQKSYFGFEELVRLFLNILGVVGTENWECEVGITWTISRKIRGTKVEIQKRERLGGYEKNVEKRSEWEWTDLR